MIPFSRRELSNAWTNAYHVSKSSPRSNAHRLLLFYAIECGLKAAWLKRNHKDILDEPIVDSPAGRSVLHDLNKLLDLLHVGRTKRVPTLKLPALHRKNGTPLVRHCAAGELNQVWRYGAQLELPNADSTVESALEEINIWLTTELK